MSDDSARLETVQRTQLQLLAEKFLGIRMEDIGNAKANSGKRRRGQSVSDTTSLAKKRRKGQKSNPWQKVMKLVALRLPPEIINQMSQHGTDAALFINDRNALRLYDPGPGEITEADQFIMCYRYIVQLQERPVKDNIRWCLQMLFFF